MMMNPVTEIDMSRKSLSAADRAKAVLVRWMGGENLDIAAMEMAHLVKEFSDRAYEEGYSDGESRVAEDRLLQFE